MYAINLSKALKWCFIFASTMKKFSFVFIDEYKVLIDVYALDWDSFILSTFCKLTYLCYVIDRHFCLLQLHHFLFPPLSIVEISQFSIRFTKIYRLPGWESDSVLFCEFSSFLLSVYFILT